MKITTERAPGGGFVMVTISHGGQRQTLLNATFARTTISDHDKLFSITNAILAKLSEADQQKVFDIYCEVKNLTDQPGMDLAQLIQSVSGLTNELYRILDLTEINADGQRSLKMSLLLRKEYYIPDTLQTEYSDNHKKELTYLRNDYIGLCGLAEALRFAIPIWLPFMRSRQEEIGTAFKEFTAVGVIYGTDVYKTIQIEILNTYIEAIIGNTRLPLAAIYAGLSDSESTEYLAALAIIRKVAIGETQTPTVDLICNVSNHARKLLKQISKKLDSTSRVIETPKPNDGAGDDNTSTAENRRLKEKLPLSRYEETKSFISRHPEVLYSRITGKRLSQRLFTECTSVINRLSKEEINHPSRLKIMLAIVRRGQIPPNMIDVLDHSYRKKLMVIATAVLVDDKNVNVLNLLTAKLTPAGSSLIMGNQLNSAISTDTLLRLNKLYYLDSPELTNAHMRRTNLAHKAILQILDDLADYDMETQRIQRIGEAGILVSRNEPYGEDLANIIIDYDFNSPYTKESQLDKVATAALNSLKNKPQ